MIKKLTILFLLLPLTIFSQTVAKVVSISDGDTIN